MHTPYGQQKEEDAIVDQRYEGGDCNTYVCVCVCVCMCVGRGGGVGGWVGGKGDGEQIVYPSYDAK